jgi:hypothetical protein
MLAPGDFARQSVLMSSSGGHQYYWCLHHHRVETEDNAGPAMRRLGSYDTASAATAMLITAAERSARWNAEDARWEGTQP